MKLFKSLFRRQAKTVPVRSRLRLERLEDRDLLSAPSIMTIAKAEYSQDGNLSRTDVIELFDTVAGTERAVFVDGYVSFQTVSNPNPNKHLSAAALTDLRDIVMASGQWGMTADVADLAGKVVGFNQANEHYHGKSLLPAGQLAAGDAAGKLSDLVQKWFYGADLPKIGVAGGMYKAAAGSLFGPNGPKASDVAQGAVGDCYFLSNLGEAALQSPQTIKNMFIADGDGTYTVRFYEYDSTTKTTTADYVTVNSELPVNSKGEFVYANYMFGDKQTNLDNSTNILWVALAEKAYAQLAEEGWSRANWSAKDDVNAYDSINTGDNRVAGQQITGNTHAAWVNILDSTKTLYTDFQNGDLLTICSNVKTTDSQIVTNHVYFVTAIDMTSSDPKDDTITLTNPYRTNKKRTITLTLEELAESFGDVAAVGL